MCDRELTVDETAAVRKGVGGDDKDAADKGPPRAGEPRQPGSGRLVSKRPAVDPAIAAAQSRSRSSRRA